MVSGCSGGLSKDNTEIVAVPAMMQMQGMNVAPIPSETLAEPTEPVKELLEE